MPFSIGLDCQAGEFTRRRLLTGALGSAAALVPASRLIAASDFWNTKDPSTWTEEEIAVLTSRSPWAKAATPSIKGNQEPVQASGGGARGMGRPVHPPNVFVLWESAQPILDAVKATPGKDFDTHYVVSVTNLLVPGLRRSGRAGDAGHDEALDRVQNGTLLQVKGKDPAEAGFARLTRIGSILFGFSRELLRLSPSDREIFFRLDTDQVTIQAKFDGKEMMYHGKMAV